MRFSEPVRGEVTLVLGPGVGDRPELDDAVRAVRELVDAGAARRSAADAVARLLGVSRNELYRASAPTARLTSSDTPATLRLSALPAQQRRGGASCIVFS